MVRPRRMFSKEFKLSVIADVEGGQTVAEVARHRQVHPDLVYQWHRQFRSQGTSAFPDRPGAVNSQDPAGAKIAELEQMVGRLTMENEFLKKALKRVEDTFVRKTQEPGTP